MSQSGVLEAVDRILNRGGDATDVLRDVLDVLVERRVVDWAAIAFVEDDRFVLGPALGGLRPDEREARAIALDGVVLAELWTTAGGDAALLDRVALLLSPYCLPQTNDGGARWSQ